MTKDEASRIRAKVGETILLTSGEYSDYEVFGVFTVLKEFGKEEVGELFKEGYVSFYSLVERLMSSEYVKALPCTEVYLGAYGELGVELREGLAGRGEERWGI